MGEIADMMLDGTMDSETGEWNFDGEDGPGWPMTSAEARAFKRHVPRRPNGKADREARRAAPFVPVNPPGQGQSKGARARRRKREADEAAANATELSTDHRVGFGGEVAA